MILQQRGTRFYVLADQETYGEPEFGEFAKISIGAAGDSWQEIEKELELPEGALTATVELYNRHAANGHDPLFRKGAKWLKALDKPPFVALDCRIDYCTYFPFPLGGLETRSEEHTAALQLLLRHSYAVLCYKKKHQSTTQ